MRDKNLQPTTSNLQTPPQFFSSKKTGAGFTLIELLVVISIIGMLSSIVLASVNSARIKARNTYTAQTVRQYITALQTSFSENGYYPSPGNSNIYCLGQAPCFLNYTISVAVNTELTKSLSSLPKTNLSPVTIAGGNLTNSFFYCKIFTGSQCSIFMIYYYLEGNTSCILQSTKSLNNNNAQCALQLGGTLGLCGNGLDDNSNGMVDEVSEC